MDQSENRFYRTKENHVTTKTLALFLVVNHDGEFEVSTECAADALENLDENHSCEAVRTVRINVIVGLPTIETVDVTVPAETRAPTQVSV